MTTYLKKRLLSVIPILLGVSFLSFLLLNLSATDFVDTMYDGGLGVLSPEALAEKRAELGLDLPFFAQYFRWLFGLFQGDFGTSFVYGVPVGELLLSRLPNTVLLAVASLVVTIAISVPLGVVATYNPKGWIAKVIRGTGFLTSATPGFLICYLLILVFSVSLGWLPSLGNPKSIVGWILPVLALALPMSAKYTRQVQSNCLAEKEKPYVDGLRARGIEEWAILFRSVLPSTFLSLLTLLSLSLGSLLGGTAVVETIFLWDGMGKLALDSAMMKDYPVVQGYVLVMALLYILLTVATDLLYHRLDPRVGGGKS